MPLLPSAFPSISPFPRPMKVPEWQDRWDRIALADFPTLTITWVKNKYFSSTKGAGTAGHLHTQKNQSRQILYTWQKNK